MPHEHDEEHDDHEHGGLHFTGTEVTDEALATVRATNAPLAQALDLTRRWSALTDDEKAAAARAQADAEKNEAWIAGYHADGDRCATCLKPTAALFTDTLDEGGLAYAAFRRGLPVHPATACLDGFAAARPDGSPRGLDKARRELMRDLDRPSPRMSQFFRHDLLAQPPFELGDWAESVVAAQPDGLDKGAAKDMQKLLEWMHQRLFH